MAFVAGADDCHAIAVRVLRQEIVPYFSKIVQWAILLDHNSVKGEVLQCWGRAVIPDVYEVASKCLLTLHPLCVVVAFV